ncbi:MAG: PIN domain-containing protein [Treponema sp.]|nr:PIN domain-containing protein [Treponema sp.]
MKVLVDTNVIIDIINKREEFVDASFGAVQSAFKGCTTCVSTTTVTDTLYITRKTYPNSESQKKLLSDFFSKFKILPVSKKEIKQAFNSPMNDFEDAVQAFSAKRAGVKVIITRNVKDYVFSPVPVITPLEFLKQQEA